VKNLSMTLVITFLSSITSINASADETSVFKILDANNYKCWTLKNGGNARRTPVVIAECGPENNGSDFDLIPYDSYSQIDRGQPQGWFYIKDVRSEMCLHTRGPTMRDREPLLLWECGQMMQASANEALFRFISLGGNDFLVQNKYSNKCMHTRAGSSASGTPIWTWTCDYSGQAREFVINLVPSLSLGPIR